MFWLRCFPVNFVKFLKRLFCTEHLRWLLLNFSSILWKWFESCPQISFTKVFKTIGRMLIGVSFSLRFLEPYLDTSVTLTNLKNAGNFDEPVHCMKGVWIQTFIGPYFPGFNYRKITSKKNPYSHSSRFVNFKACIFSKIISIFLEVQVLNQCP